MLSVFLLYQIGIRSLVATHAGQGVETLKLYQIGIRSLVATIAERVQATEHYIKLELEV